MWCILIRTYQGSRRDCLSCNDRRLSTSDIANTNRNCRHFNQEKKFKKKSKSKGDICIIVALKTSNSKMCVYVHTM